MPVTPTYPGVYVEEIPSGVHTITGVSTSVTAFVGAAKRGPINKAVNVLSYSDFERSFGGLDSGSELSYAVRQFFLNGGSNAWIVRLAQKVESAKAQLTNSEGQPVLSVIALDEGQSGNNIEVLIDYETTNPASTFNLSFKYRSLDNPTDQISEVFKNLSMNPHDANYVFDVVNGSSKLVTIERSGEMPTITGRGTSISGELTEPLSQCRDDYHNQFRVVVNGSSPVSVEVSEIAGSSLSEELIGLCAQIEDQVRGADRSNGALTNFSCVPQENRILMTSGGAGEQSSVRILPGIRNDISARLSLGTLSGGVERDAASGLRPTGVAGKLTSGSFSASDFSSAVPSDGANSFKIKLDDYEFLPVSLSIANPLTQGNLGEKLRDIARRIESAVQALKPNNPAYRNFKCSVAGSASSPKLQLISGTSGANSSVMVQPADSRDIAAALHLLPTAASQTKGQDLHLTGGSESPFKADDNDTYNLFIADRSQRKGIYALESVDLFNILCLPGITNSGILLDAVAYCASRRAFLIADAPLTSITPADMVSTASGTALPKSDYGAVYYPWIYIADPLSSGKLRLTAPSGTIAGLYARTDSSRGVWKAPAGTEANLAGVQAVSYKLTDGENGSLNQLGVNCIRLFPAYGAVSWGARTLKGADQAADEYKYIPVRRLALYLQESLYRGTQWVVFEPNDEPLWAQIRLNLGAFMHSLFRQGAFQGKSPREAYFVKCDGETTTQNDINLGIVNISVGFAPLKPAEFVIIQLQQMAGQIQV